MPNGDPVITGNFNRRLAAIMFTDMVGYTGVMQRDEMLAIKMQKRHQSVVETQVATFGGQVKNDMGDGSMSILPSAYAVIQCAMAVQRELQNHEPKVNIRIGIHIADVLEEESGKVHGDGINIASRIETLGVAGAILFSKEIYNKIKNHPEFKIHSVGSYPFKNVDESMEIFAIANEGFNFPTEEQAYASGKLKKASSASSPPQLSKTNYNYKYLYILPLIGIIGYLVIQNINRQTNNTRALEEKNIQVNLKTKTWSGKVIYSDNSSAARQVIIDINGQKVDTTDINGEYSFTLPKESEGTSVKLTLWQDGEQKISEFINLSKQTIQPLKVMRKDD